MTGVDWILVLVVVGWLLGGIVAACRWGGVRE